MFYWFKVRAEGVGAEVHRFQTKTDALDFIVSVPAETTRLVSCDMVNPKKSKFLSFTPVI